MTFDDQTMREWSRRLQTASARVGADFPGERPERQPVHTVYGGAQLFSSETASRLGSLAIQSLERWLPGPDDLVQAVGMDSALATQVHPLVREKLAREAVEDFRIDFEDGYGHRPDEEEDGHARSTAMEVAA
ncbi:MAG TPA: aldolase, partial [Acidimicrobiia bacterium]